MEVRKENRIGEAKEIRGRVINSTLNKKRGAIAIREVSRRVKPNSNRNRFEEDVITQ
jgi:hypothetical protein